MFTTLSAKCSPIVNTIACHVATYTKKGTADHKIEKKNVNWENKLNFSSIFIVQYCGNFYFQQFWLFVFCFGVHRVNYCMTLNLLNTKLCVYGLTLITKFVNTLFATDHPLIESGACKPFSIHGLRGYNNDNRK